MQFSFIIPALNEEKNIALVITQFRRLRGAYSYEVIVVDGGSKDRTCAVAKSLGAKLIVGLPDSHTIGWARNVGAKKARGDILVFCDADTLLSDVRRFAERVTETFRDTNVVAALPRLKVFPAERRWKDVFFIGIFNAFLSCCLAMGHPFAFGQCQIVRAKEFRAVGGYNKHQVHAEDSELYQRLIKRGRIRILSDLTVYESPRRYRKYGYIRTAFIGIRSIFNQRFLKRQVIKEWVRVD